MSSALKAPSFYHNCAVTVKEMTIQCIYSFVNSCEGGEKATNHFKGAGLFQ